MDFDKSKRNPPSARILLYNQVKEQSDLCDVTIKYGLWEKKFHWCVLVACPFFENMRNHSYRERDTGIVAMHVGTPVSLEEAILYLYGKKPNINSSNIAALLEIAEYLMISDLKAKCIMWIQNTKITDESCLAMIQLASLYDFSLSSYEVYMKCRLPDLMQMDEMMDLTAESVESILEDPNLSHIKASDKFSFLVRWTKKRQNRKSVFGNLKKHIDFGDMERSFIRDVVMNEPLVHELDASSSFIEQLESLKSLSFSEILLFPNTYYDNKLRCYDMNRHRWCSLSINWEEKRHIFYKSKMSDLAFVGGKDSSEAYIYNRSYKQTCINIINFENNSVKRSVVKDVHYHGSKTRHSNLEKVYVYDDELIVMSNEQVESHRNQSAAINSRVERKPVYVSHLNVGKIENDVTITVPILSLRGAVSHVCANKTTIAMLQCDTNVLYLYNRKDSSLETIDLTEKEIYLQRSDTIVEAGDGFVIYDNEHFVSIAKQMEPSLLNNYLIIKTKWCPEKTNEYISERHYFCKNKWYHYKRGRMPLTQNKSLIKNQVFVFTTHEKVMVAVQDKAEIPMGIWEDMQVYEARYRDEDPGTKIFQIKVSRERLSCSFNCTHCKLQRVAEKRTLRNNYEDGDDNSSLYNYEDSDDNSSLYSSDIDESYGYTSNTSSSCNSDSDNY